MNWFRRIFNWERGAGFVAPEDGIAAAAAEIGLNSKAARRILAELDIDNAISSHENWKIRLEAYLAGHSSEDMRPEVVCREDCCDLGRWLNGDGRTQLGNYPVYGVLLARHKNFHIQASNVVSLVQSQQPERAERTLNGPFRHVSNQIILLLKALRNSLHK